MSLYPRYYYAYQGDNSYRKNFFDLSVKNSKGQSITETPGALSFSSGLFSGFAIYYGECVGQPEKTEPSSSRTATGLETSGDIVGGLNKTLTAALFDKAVLNKMGNVFGDNFFLSNITNPKSRTCALQPGQSTGTRYENIAALVPSSVKKYPICSDS